jgi:hypothetical protein
LLGARLMKCQGGGGAGVEFRQQGLQVQRPRDHKDVDVVF